jgi:hypothetical protein
LFYLFPNSVHFPKNVTETTNFEQDIAGGLSQVLSDGTNTYLYGYNRIAQVGPSLPTIFGVTRWRLFGKSMVTGEECIQESERICGDIEWMRT